MDRPGNSDAGMHNYMGNGLFFELGRQLVDNVAQHETPAPGQEANFLVRADLREDLAGRYEQLWARQIGTHTFKVCSIPFFTHGFALGDTVRTDFDYEIQEVIERKGHRVLRIAVTNEVDESVLHPLLHKWVENSGHFYEF